MAEAPRNLAASVKQRLLNKARQDGRAFDILLVRFALERLLFRLSLSAYREKYILKGGMLVTQWLEHDNRETHEGVHWTGFNAGAVNWQLADGRIPCPSWRGAHAGGTFHMGVG